MDEFSENIHKHPHSRRRQRVRRIRVTSTVCALLALAVGTFAKTSPQTINQIVSEPVRQTISETTQTVVESQPGLWHVSHAVDGDTIDVTMGSQKETVRFIGIDTPETHDPRKPVQCFGEAAAAHTKELLEGKNVRLEPDPTNSDRDKYHRLLRYVYLPDGTLVNAALVHDGYAFAYTIFPFTKLDEFRALEHDARDSNRGLWGGCNVNEATDIKQTTSAKN